MDGWIPIKDRLPEVRYDSCGNVLSDDVIIWRVKDSEGGEFEGYDIGFFVPKTECFEKWTEQGYWETICHISKVKAWMPLPKPYTSEVAP